MTESHVLALKIDAAPATAGARKFRGAINSVKQAVRDLERSTDGAFAKLKNASPKLDVAPLKAAQREAQALARDTDAASSASARAAENIRKMAVQSANALRVSTDQASRLRDRLLSVGDTNGLAKLDAGLQNLRSNLIAATSGLDIREARAGYADLASELNRTAREAERLNAIANAEARAQAEAAAAAQHHAAELDALRAKFNPLYAVSKRYEEELGQIARAEREGAISAAIATKARERAAAQLTELTAAGTRTARGMSRTGLAVQNASYQVADFAVQVSNGTGALRAMGMQLPQLLAGFGIWGAAAGAVAAILSGLIPVLFSGGQKAKTFADATSDLTSSMALYRKAAVGATSDTLTLYKEFGRSAESARDFYKSLAAIEKIKLANKLAENVDALGTSLKGVTDLMSQWDKATLLPPSLRADALVVTRDAVRKLRDEYGLTINQAHALAAAMADAKMAKTPEETAAAVKRIASALIRAHAAGAQLPPSLVDAAEQAAKLGLNADRLNALLHPLSGMVGSATGQTTAWQRAMAGVGAEVSAIMSSLSSLSGSVISNTAKEAELKALQAGKSVQAAAVARQRAIKQAQWSASEAAAGGGIKGMIQSGLNALDRTQFERGVKLDTEIAAARAKATKAAHAATAKLTNGLTRQLDSLKANNLATELFAAGQTKTTDGAQALATAMVKTGGAVDATTLAMVNQIDHAAELHKQLSKLANDPVKQFLASVPNWQEAGSQIEAGVFGNLRDSIAGLITGKGGIKDLGNAILGTVSQVVSSKAVKELAHLMGETGKGGSWLGQLLGKTFRSAGDSPAAGLQNGAASAGNTINAAMISAGQTVSANIRAAMTGGSVTARQQVQTGLTVGAAQVRSGAQTGLSVGSAQVRAAGTQGGARMKAGVVQGSAQGAQALAAGVRAGAGGAGRGLGGLGGGGGGLSGLLGGIFGNSTGKAISDGLGGWGGLFSSVIGAFSEGGYSNQPVGFASMPAAAFHNAPHYAEGTQNTSGGMPAVLHPNEAVIPLSRGRKVPVELSGAQNAGRAANITNNFHINTPDADSFRKSRQQIAADMARAGRQALAQDD